MIYRIWLLMPDGVNWYELCQCDSPDNLCSVLAALLKHRSNPASPIKIDTIPVT